MVFYKEFPKMKNLRHAFGLTITDVSENHEKIDVNIAGDVWQKGGGAH